MVLLVDGYNVIKYLLPHNQHEHDAQRYWLIARLATYSKAKQGEVSEVVVVFDGGLFRHRQREAHRGVVIVFAGQKQSADDVLVEYAEKYKAGSVLVSNDRELCMRCHEHGSQGIDVATFDTLCSRVCLAPVEQELHQLGEVTITKIADDTDPTLDALMEAGSIGTIPVRSEDDEVSAQRRKGRKLNKAARARRRLHKKLG